MPSRFTGLLEYSIQKGGFQRNAEWPLKTDLVVVDEASMVDTLLMAHLLAGIPRTARLILVGDVHQLPSVGPGNVLGTSLLPGAFRWLN
jgi:exodeoxyribonuclease V alpha subunit